MQWTLVNRFCLALIILRLSSAHPGHGTLCPEMTSCVCDYDLQPELNSTSLPSNWVMTTVMDCQNESLTAVPNFTTIISLGLERLWLDNNDIEYIGGNAFLQTKFQEVRLHGNNINIVQRNAFESLKDTLLKLTLSLKVTPSGLAFLSGMVNLLYLDVSGSYIQNGELSLGIFKDYNLFSLKHLNMENINMNVIDDGAFMGLESLETLKIGYNSFKTVPVDLKSLINLKELSIRNNKALLQIESSSFAGLNSVTTLIISGNKLRTFPSAVFERLDNLESLDISFNELTHISADVFEGQYELKHLSIGGNPLYFKDTNMFGRVSDTLRSLSLSDMSIARAPTDVLRKLPKLNELSMEGCSVSRIDDDFFSGLSLSSVDLSYNSNLNYISKAAINDLKMPITLLVRGTALRDLSFLLDIPDCGFDFKLLDINDVNIPCGCDLKEVIDKGQISGSISGTCDFEIWDRYYFTIDDSNITSSFPPDLETRLSSVCQKVIRKKRQTCDVNIVSSSADSNRIYARYFMLIFVFTRIFISG